MAAAEVDYSYLCTHAGVPQSDLDTVVTAPTVDLVKSVLDVIVSKFQELEQDKFQLGVELEGAIRGAESRCEQFKSTTDKALKEVEELRQKLQGEGKNQFFCLDCETGSPNVLPPQKRPGGQLRTSFKPSSPPAQHRSRRSRRFGRASPLSKPPTAKL